MSRIFLVIRLSGFRGSLAVPMVRDKQVLKQTIFAIV